MRVQGQHGFTLIELLTVVAILGILAAVAIPQFAAYRQRGHNAAAHADARNVVTGEESYFFGAHAYLPVALQMGPREVDSLGNGSGDKLPGGRLSSQVAAAVATSGSGINGSYFTIGASHRQGNRIFYLESDEGRWKFRHKVAGVAQAAAEVAGATSAVDVSPDGVL